MVEDVHDDNSSFSTPAKSSKSGDPPQGKAIPQTPVTILTGERTVERTPVQPSSPTGLKRPWALMPHYPTALNAFPQPLQHDIVSTLL